MHSDTDGCTGADSSWLTLAQSASGRTRCSKKATLTHEAREKAEAEVMADLLDIERQEAAVVWRGQSEGLPVEHRADCSPLAILQLRLITAPRADVPATSAGHAWDIVMGRR